MTSFKFLIIFISFIGVMQAIAAPNKQVRSIKNVDGVFDKTQTDKKVSDKKVSDKKVSDKKKSGKDKWANKKESRKSHKNKTPANKKAGSKTHKQPLQAHLHHTAKKHGIDPMLVKAIIKVESGGKSNARSSKGAIGLMQVMPKTARQYGKYNLKDPKQNITVGVRHFANLKKRYKDTKLALAAYNAGEGNVDKYGNIPPFKETKRYVKNTMATYRAYKSNAG